MRDQFGRKIDYLRVSVTDRCNFRCVYCMPERGLPWLPKTEILSYEEIGDVVAQFVALGVRRVRISGGEPTIRPQLARLVRLLAAIPGIEDLSLSTNGVELSRLASELAEAGLHRVNISSDSLRSDRIAAIARRSLSFDPIVAIDSALAARLEPVKINVVVLRRVNDDEIADYARLTFDRPIHVRFIELMPVGDMRELTWEHVVPTTEVLERIAAVGSLEPGGGPGRGNGPAEYYHLAGAQGSVGVIHPLSHTYCGSCNRVRLTADGRLRTCLFGDHEIDLRTPLRAGNPLAPLVERAMAGKPREHALLQMRTGGLVALSQTGG